MKSLATYRKESGLTQLELSEAIGIPLSSIAMYETGQRMPSLARARKFAKFFNVSMDNIFFGKEYHEM
jgi:putative transcriptional regulator